MNDYLLFAAALLFTLFGHVNDGLISVKPNVGWLKSHIVYWLRRDIPMYLILLGWALAPNTTRIILGGMLLLVNALHSPILKLTEGSVDSGWWKGSGKPNRIYRWVFAAGLIILIIITWLRL
jgi:hypothetical protein